MHPVRLHLIACASVLLDVPLGTAGHTPEEKIVSTIEDYALVWEALRRRARDATYPDGWGQCTACEGTGAADIDPRNASVTEECGACVGRGAVITDGVIIPDTAVDQGVRSLAALGVTSGDHAKEAARVAIDAAAWELVENNAGRVATSELRSHIIAFTAMADVAAAQGDTRGHQVWLDAAEHLERRAHRLVERDPYTPQGVQRLGERHRAAHQGEPS